MNLKEILVLLDKESDIKQFMMSLDDFDGLIKSLDWKEIKRLNLEYPNFLNKQILNQIQLKEESKNFENDELIICITLVKHDFNHTNYIKLKKIKIYIDAVSDKIIKVLQN